MEKKNLMNGVQADLVDHADRVVEFTELPVTKCDPGAHRLAGRLSISDDVDRVMEFSDGQLSVGN